MRQGLCEDMVSAHWSVQSPAAAACNNFAAALTFLLRNEESTKVVNSIWVIFSTAKLSRKSLINETNGFHNPSLKASAKLTTKRHMYPLTVAYCNGVNRLCLVKLLTTMTTIVTT